MNDPIAKHTAAIVTGHSRGLGAAIAAHLLARGIHVMGVARRKNSDLRTRHEDALTEVELDLADGAELSRWLASDAVAGHVRSAERALLVNNAGVLQPIGPLATQDASDVVRSITVNIAAALAISAAFAAATENAGDRRILHVSSGAARHAVSGWSVYCASKAAMNMHAMAVAIEGSSRLRVCAVAPGVIDTDMQAEIRASSDVKMPDRQRFVDMKRDGRLIDADEAGRAVVDFLLSREFGEEPVTDLRVR